MFLCRNRQYLQESSMFEMRAVNVFINHFFSMKWGIFEKMRLFFCFFHSEWQSRDKWKGNDISVNTKCHSDDRREEESREHPLNTLTLCYRDSSLRSEWQECSALNDNHVFWMTIASLWMTNKKITPPTATTRKWRLRRLSWRHGRRCTENWSRTARQWFRG